MCRGVAAGFWGARSRAENSFSDVTPGREEDQQLVASFTFNPIWAAWAKLHIEKKKKVFTSSPDKQDAQRRLQCYNKHMHNTDTHSPAEHFLHATTKKTKTCLYFSVETIMTVCVCVCLCQNENTGYTPHNLLIVFTFNSRQCWLRGVSQHVSCNHWFYVYKRFV